MICINRFCIYQKDGKCLLDEIELDSDGKCECCIYPDIPGYVLEYEKEKVRKRFEQEDNDY